MRSLLDFSDLSGWRQDDHRAALDTFLESCDRSATGDLIPAEDWQGLCAAGRAALDPRIFFETGFRPVLIEDGAEPLFTGYYEPELQASRRRTERFRYPLYRRPPEIAGRSEPWLTRAEIERGALAGRGLEIAWLDDPVDAFFLHVQGSGRLLLQDGSILRVGFGGRNNHPYRSVGRYMAEAGLLPAHRVSAGGIRAWVQENGAIGREVLHRNPSFIFFRAVEGLGTHHGPVGAMGVPVSAGRSIAVDPDAVPLGLPVWLETETAEGPLTRLMVAQDVGAAVKGAQRADIFFGSGEAAYALAGRQRAGGRMVVLMPRALVEGD
ncbi:murein transglycosylase A [Roseobacter sp. HKCCA0434]|uniref:murein transglycosylase A n=1 Tax=Roseobacter sp. HKCCA0434 TaxID=3079297 RepID=UPI002905D7BA|nr:murein transglycosylase A [Roseobacter sp. HKCCA0434]